jgi:hypothetical protein
MEQLIWIEYFGSNDQCIMSAIVGPYPSDWWWGYDAALDEIRRRTETGEGQ